MSTPDQHASTYVAVAKHAGDVIAIPGGLFGIASHYLGLMNELMTFLVLITTFIYGVYRIRDMKSGRQAKK